MTTWLFKSKYISGSRALVPGAIQFCYHLSSRLSLDNIYIFSVSNFTFQNTVLLLISPPILEPSSQMLYTFHPPP